MRSRAPIIRPRWQPIPRLSHRRQISMSSTRGLPELSKGKSMTLVTMVAVSRSGSVGSAAPQAREPACYERVRSPGLVKKCCLAAIASFVRRIQDSKVDRF